MENLENGNAEGVSIFQIFHSNFLPSLYMQDNKIGLIIGGSAAFVIILLLIAVIVYFATRKKDDNGDNKSDNRGGDNSSSNSGQPLDKNKGAFVCSLVQANSGKIKFVKCAVDSSFGTQKILSLFPDGQKDIGFWIFGGGRNDCVFCKNGVIQEGDKKHFANIGKATIYAFAVKTLADSSAGLKPSPDCMCLAKYPNRNFFASAPQGTLYLQDNSIPIQNGHSELRIDINDEDLLLMDQLLNPMNQFEFEYLTNNKGTAEIQKFTFNPYLDNWEGDLALKTKDFKPTAFIQLQFYDGGMAWCERKTMKESATKPTKKCFIIPVSDGTAPKYADVAGKGKYCLVADSADPDKSVYLEQAEVAAANAKNLVFIKTSGEISNILNKLISGKCG